MASGSVTGIFSLRLTGVSHLNWVFGIVIFSKYFFTPNADPQRLGYTP